MSEGVIRALKEQDQRLSRTEVKEVPSGFGIGTAFPASPASGARFFRTDLGWLCYYDGTRWLTVHDYLVPLTTDFLSATVLDAEIVVVEPRTDYAPYITRCIAVSRVATTNNGTNYWVVTFQGRNINFSAASSISQFNTSADAVNTYVRHEEVPNVTATPANDDHLALRVEVVGAPGTLTLLASIQYRLVVT